jgi:Helix-turn-helix
MKAMSEKKKIALKAKGYRVGDIDEFLCLSPEELRIVEMRVLVGRLVKEGRTAKKMSQGDLAVRIDSTQARVSKIESAADGVSLDLMFLSFFAVGGEMSDIAKATATPKAQPRKRAAKVLARAL